MQSTLWYDYNNYKNKQLCQQWKSKWQINALKTNEIRMDKDNVWKRKQPYQKRCERYHRDSQTQWSKINWQRHGWNEKDKQTNNSTHDIK